METGQWLCTTQALSMLDWLVIEFINTMWQEHELRGYAAAFLSGWARYLQQMRRQFGIARSYLSSWERTLSRRRALPAAQHMVTAWAGVVAGLQRWDLAALFLLGFYSIFRTDEIVCLKVEHLQFRQGIHSWQWFCHRQKQPTATMRQRAS